MEVSGTDKVELFFGTAHSIRTIFILIGSGTHYSIGMVECIVWDKAATARNIQDVSNFGPDRRSTRFIIRRALAGPSRKCSWNAYQDSNFVTSMTDYWRS